MPCIINRQGLGLGGGGLGYSSLLKYDPKKNGKKKGINPRRGAVPVTKIGGKAAASVAAGQAVSSARAELADYLDTLAGLGHEIRAVPGAYGPGTRLIEVAQQIEIAGKKGTADMYAVAAIVSANPLSPITVVYRNAAGSNEFYDFGQYDENGVVVADKAFASTSDDNGLGTVFAALKTDSASHTEFRAFELAFKSMNCVGGHCHLVSYGNITNTEGFVRTFEAENRDQWSLGNSDDLPLMAQSSSAQRLPSFETLSMYSLTEQGKYFVVSPSTSNLTPHRVPALTNPTGVATWVVGSGTLVASDPGLAFAAAHGTPYAPFGLDDVGGYIAPAPVVCPASGVCDPDFDVRLFDLQGLGTSSKLVLSARLIFAVEPYVTKLSRYPSPSHVRNDQVVGKVAQQLMLADRKGKSPSELKKFLSGLATAGEKFLLGPNQKLDWGDLAHFARDGFSLIQAADGNPLPLITSVAKRVGWAL